MLLATRRVTMCNTKLAGTAASASTSAQAVPLTALITRESVTVLQAAEVIKVPLSSRGAKLGRRTAACCFVLLAPFISATEIVITHCEGMALGGQSSASRQRFWSSV